uniref:Mos1 transposase HTH domain-containing protein n=1 Tax=Acrobeloides nanus TaxID=290746 RepID=A0A914ED37_9BILA
MVNPCCKDKGCCDGGKADCCKDGPTHCTSNHILIRNILLFYFDQNKSDADAFRDLNVIYGDGTISRAQCFQWFARFKEGDRSLEDKKDNQDLLNAVEEDQSLTTRKNNVILLYDNAKPHVERRVVESIQNKGWEILPHPSHFPTEAPTEYHVNRSVSNRSGSSTKNLMTSWTRSVAGSPLRTRNGLPEVSTCSLRNGKQFLMLTANMHQNNQF